nr:unnamed protein product [Digitaria exilis]
MTTKSMNDGEISISAYDTAWVALVPKLDGEGPQFPAALRWIVDNQLPNGSWGDSSLIAKEEQDSMPIGFELAFPSLIQTARNLGIDFPYDHPALQSIYSNREIKLKRIVKKFNGGVPNVYPVDLFEHIWVVDRLERLGISRYFQREIKQCMDYALD